MAIDSNVLKKKYNDKAKLLFTDTDSLTYAYKDFWSDKDKFDNSEYPENSLYFDKLNKKVIGRFKDEVSGIPINTFIGLRSKMYSYLKDTDEGGKTAKSVKKNVIKKSIKHENYKEVLFNNKQVYYKMKTIRSKRYQFGSYKINKISLSCFDEKRYLHDSYTYGHYEI